MNPFSWLRTAARNAVLGGIADAVEQVAADSQAAITVKVELPAIAGPAERTDEPKRRKATP